MKILLTIFVLLIGLSSFTISNYSKHPVPQKNKELLFYIQRNHNSNTIVYNANFDNKGNLTDHKPIDVFWIRYEEQGQRMELRTIEKKFAYGVECENIEGKKNQYKVKLVAKKDREFILIQYAPFKATVYTTINNKLSSLNHLYIQADNSGLWPSVKYIELFGIDTKTKENTYEKIMN